MRFHHTIIAALALTSGASLLPSTEAFTNGLYLPSYICGPAIANTQTGVITGTDPVPPTAAAAAGTTPKTYPKALAGVLAQFVEFGVAAEAAAGATYKPAVDPKLWVAVMHAANTQAGLTPFGGTAPFAESLVNGAPALDTTAAMNAQAIMTAAQTNVLHVGAQVTAATAANATAQSAILKNTIALENVIPASTTTQITPNQLVTLTLQSQNNILGAAKGGTAQTLAQFAAQGNPAVLDGAVVYAQDQNNKRVGHFTAAGPNMALWPACNPTPPAAPNDRSGIVHTQLLSPFTNSYTGPQFFLPFDFTWKLKVVPGQLQPVVVNGGTTTITFMGAAVSDNGFGYHQTQWQVQPLPDFPVDTGAVNADDFVKCVFFQNSPACIASCLDCVIQGGSTPTKAATNTATFTCSAVAGTGNTAQGQAAVWTATCSVKGKGPVTIVPAGTLPVTKPTTKDATTGNEMPLSANQQALVDQMNSQLVAMVNGTDTTQTCTNTNTQGKSVNTATNTHTTWFATITLAFGTLLATLRQ